MRKQLKISYLSIIISSSIFHIRGFSAWQKNTMGYNTRNTLQHKYHDTDPRWTDAGGLVCTIIFPHPFEYPALALEKVSISTRDKATTQHRTTGPSRRSQGSRAAAARGPLSSSTTIATTKGRTMARYKTNRWQDWNSCGRYSLVWCTQQASQPGGKATAEYQGRAGRATAVRNGWGIVQGWGPRRVALDSVVHMNYTTPCTTLCTV